MFPGRECASGSSFYQLCQCPKLCPDDPGEVSSTFRSGGVGPGAVTPCMASVALCPAGHQLTICDNNTGLDKKQVLFVNFCEAKRKEKKIATCAGTCYTVRCGFEPCARALAAPAVCCVYGDTHYSPKGTKQEVSYGQGKKGSDHAGICPA